jgi:hypothetical protein
MYYIIKLIRKSELIGGINILKVVDFIIDSIVIFYVIILLVIQSIKEKMT